MAAFYTEDVKVQKKYECKFILAKNKNSFIERVWRITDAPEIYVKHGDMRNIFRLALISEYKRSKA